MTKRERYLDVRWQKKKHKILLRDNYQCRKCGRADTTLHVHHGEYHGAPWETPDNMLVTLCKNCHPQGAVKIAVILADLMPKFQECCHCGFPYDPTDFCCEQSGCPQAALSKEPPEVDDED